MDLEGTFLDLDGALLHSLPKSREPWPFWPPVPTSLPSDVILLYFPKDTERLSILYSHSVNLEEDKPFLNLHILSIDTDRG